MLAYGLRRLISAIPTLFILITLAFFMIRAAPGGPFDTERNIPVEIQINLDRMYHLDEPLIQQYGRYLWNIMQGNFGPSFQYKDYTVNELIQTGFPVSLRLGAAAIVLSIIAGCGIGMLAAIRQNQIADYSVMSLAMIGISDPSFVMAPLLILIFAVYLGWLPASGWKNGSVIH